MRSDLDSCRLQTKCRYPIVFQSKMSPCPPSEGGLQSLGRHPRTRSENMLGLGVMDLPTLSVLPFTLQNKGRHVNTLITQTLGIQVNIRMKAFFQRPSQMN